MRAKVKDRVELYLYSASGPSWPVIGWTSTLHTQQSYNIWGTVNIQVFGDVLLCNSVQNIASQPWNADLQHHHSENVKPCIKAPHCINDDRNSQLKYKKSEKCKAFQQDWSVRNPKSQTKYTENTCTPNRNTSYISCLKQYIWKNKPPYLVMILFGRQKWQKTFLSLSEYWR